MKKKVFINIVNYNSERYIETCIESVRRQTYESIELLVTDNASDQKSIDFITDNFPGLNISLNKTNLGFAKAHNLAIDSHEFDFYMPLNPDIIMEPTYITEMVKAIESDGKIGSVNGKILFINSRGEKTDYLYSAGHEFDRARRGSNRGYKQKDSIEFEKESFVFGANGAAPLYKREFLDETKLADGYFDNDFFMYGEDLDLGWRGLLLGFKCLYVPGAVAYHYGFGSNGLKNPYIQYQYERNRFIAIYKNDLPWFFLSDLPIILLHEALNLSFYMVTSPGRVLQYFRAIIGFLKILPKKRVERSEIMTRKVVNDQEIRKFYLSPLFRNLLRRMSFQP